eukprot:gnl/Spiro4/2998_TR1474_c0_g1_i1.p1 gnl/Spiro4/2998_TR1474_c0_g1~~gnl/Spiro4/2998_TR1474_c0_g1_i1.p1  ORF type:complete len:953 (-),score=216.28 gnl/Spiro4/2998_TR1474_c0_g1_i1:53-2911(-)
MEHTTRLVQSVLHAGDTCVLAVELKQVKNRQRGILALITNVNHPNEHALFHLHMFDDFPPLVVQTVPILQDLGAKKKGDSYMFNQESTSYLFKFATLTQADSAALITETLKAVHLARQEKMATVTGHAWVNLYGPPKVPPVPTSVSPFCTGQSLQSSATFPPFSSRTDTSAAISPSGSYADESVLSSAAGGGAPPPPGRRDGSENSPAAGMATTADPVIYDRLQKDSDVAKLVEAREGQQDMSEVRAAWVRKQMKARAGEFTELKNLRILCATWNVNGKKPGEAIDNWLQVAAEPDIVVVGFQEIVELTPGNVVMNWGYSNCKPWEEHILTTLGNRDYTHIHSKHLVGVALMVFLKNAHMPYLLKVESTKCGIGMMGVMGNKGGVIMRVLLYNSSFAFVSAHLSADRKSAESRNQGYRDILRRTVFATPDGPMTILDHDYVFWVGDLNYRLNLGDAEARQLCRDVSNISILKQYDQLLIARSENKAFVELNEGFIGFLPTYKYDPGTVSTYDTSDKARTPAWCDRILFKGPYIQQINYMRHEHVTSDHKPVSSLLEIKVNCIVKSREHQTHQTVLRLLDHIENESISNLVMESNSVSFPKVFYCRPATQLLTIENPSQFPVEFCFLPKPSETNICKPWLSVLPENGILTANESLQVKFTIFVDNAVARSLTHSSYSLKNLIQEDTSQVLLDDILVLHLKNGRDFFITVQGYYQKSCFGSSLEKLCCLSAPIRPLPRPSPDQQQDSTQQSQSQSPQLQQQQQQQPPPPQPQSAAAAAQQQPQSPLSVPKELWRCVDFIFRNGVHEEELFLRSGDPREMDEIRECLDTGAEFLLCSVHSMAETLILLLESFEEPVIPQALYHRCLNASADPAQCRLILHDLPTLHYNVFVYLTAFMREPLAHANVNNLTVKALAVVFSNCFLRTSAPPTVRRREELEKEKKVKFLSVFLSETEQ